MKFRLLSDLHLEFEKQHELNDFGGMIVPPLPEDASTVLVLAGDIGLADRPYTFETFIQRASEQFQDVIWICGNHEYYHTSFIRGIPKIKERLLFLDVPNVHFDNNFTVIIDGTAFICATLWTDMDHDRDPTASYFISGPNGLNDFKLIRNGTRDAPYKRPLKTFDCVVDFKHSKRIIFEEIAKHKAAGLKTVVVTHHGPSYQSVANQFKGDRFNPAYVTELSDEIIDVGGPNVWVHGHTHVSLDYMIGDVTRVVVNPRGYVPHDCNPDFDPELVVEL